MIQIQHLTKTYRIARKASGLKASLRGLFLRTYEDVHAVRDLSFAIESGERVGFLGPNGAGKTTTLKILAGLLAPTAGTISVLGLNPRHRPVALLKSITLVMGQKQQLLWDLPPVETFELNRAVYDIDRAAYQKTLADLTERLELQTLINKPTRQLSLGERMKCELTAALLHRPKVLFLDEPTIGLDVSMQLVIRRFIKEYNETSGATILLTSHYMDDVTALCPRVIVIDKGRLRHDGDLARLVADTHPHKRITVSLGQPASDADVATLTGAAPALVLVERAGAQLGLRCPPDRISEGVRALLERFSVLDLKVEDPPLEEVMQDLFKGVTEPPVSELDVVR